MTKRVDIFINSLRGGGAERMCVIFANAAAARGWDVHLVVLDMHGAVYADQIDPRVRLITFNIPHARNAVGAITAYIRETHPTCCYSFASLLTILLVLLRDLHHFPIHIIGEQHNNLIIQQRAYRKSLWYGHIAPYIRRLVYTRADHIVAVSEGVRQQLLNHFGFSPMHVTTIYNCIDPHLQQRAAETLHSSSQRDIYAVGRLHYQKGFDRLLEAFALCRDERTDLHLHIVGEGPERASLEQQVQRLQLEQHVTFHGFVRDVASIYPQMAVLVMSSHYEAFGLVLVEANTFGVPVVAFDCDFGPAEIIVEGVNGYLVPQNDIRGLADAILRALTTCWDADAIRATATRFSLDTIVKAKLDLIQRVCYSYSSEET